MEKIRKIDRCLICGCTEHKLIGCIQHWKDHNKNEKGICIKKR